MEWLLPCLLVNDADRHAGVGSNARMMNAAVVYYVQPRYCYRCCQNRVCVKTAVPTKTMYHTCRVRS